MPDNLSTEIILVTHGLTEWNKQNRLQGHIDTPLAPEGHCMAKCLAESLTGHMIQGVYSSDLQRAMQTAEPAARALGLDIIVEPELREGRSRCPENSAEYPLLPFYKDHETEQEVLQRMWAVMDRIAAQHPGQRVLVVSHGGAVGLFVNKVLELSASPWCFMNIRTAVNKLCYRNQHWICQTLDDDSHLR